MRGMRLVMLVLAALSVAALPVLAQSGGDYHLTRWTVDGGGARLSAPPYLLHGTAGQPEAGAALSGGDYHLIGGFWPGGESGQSAQHIFLPLVLRNR